MCSASHMSHRDCGSLFKANISSGLKLHTLKMHIYNYHSKCILQEFDENWPGWSDMHICLLRMITVLFFCTKGTANATS
jgi:hypothetical protein